MAISLPVPFIKRKKGGSQISVLGRCGRKKTQFSSSTIASDPCACTCKMFDQNMRAKSLQVELSNKLSMLERLDKLNSIRKQQQYIVAW
ncbi:hypothetical protein NC653_009455 [Populus alba x Populus x berolinensis]|uniref:Uncharacterized protein n=1 Tax=Populus alba x Populus x berolinensis TaxID=444605 RepID=A0AAD6R9F4_9ROSI|nr:hypothetical protein NC653_009455 [Populus alba x Populus x berolinensis]